MPSEIFREEKTRKRRICKKTKKRNEEGKGEEGTCLQRERRGKGKEAIRVNKLAEESRVPFAIPHSFYL